MRFVTALKSAWGATKTAFSTVLKTMANVATAGAERLGLPGSSRPKVRNAKQWLEAFNNVSALQAPVSRLAEDVSALTWQLLEILGIDKDGKLLVRRLALHPLLDLWKQPNPFLTVKQFVWLLVVYRNVTGRVAIYVERKAGVPVALWPIAPHDILAIPTPKHKGWKLRLRGETIRPRLDEVIWFTRIDPADPYGWGCGRAQAVAQEVSQIEYAQSWNTNFFRQGAHVGQIVNIPGMSPDNGKRMRADWEANHAGINNAHRPFFTGGGKEGNVTVSSLGSSHKDLEFVQGMKHLRDSIRQNWSQPPELHGDSANSNRATSDNAQNLHQQLNILPESVELALHINAQLVPLFGDNLIFWPENPVQETKQFMLERCDKGVARGVLRADEWREEQGLSALGGVMGRGVIVPVNTVIIDPETGKKIVDFEGDPGAAGPGGPEAATNEMSLRDRAIQLLLNRNGGSR